MQSNFTVFITTLLVTSLILGCNALKGAGKDVENVGAIIPDVAA